MKALLALVLCGVRAISIGVGVCLALSCGVFCMARAGEPASPPPPGSQLSASTKHPGPGTALVAVPEPSAKAIRHYRSGMVLLVGFAIWNLAVPTLFLLTGLSARIRAWAERAGRKWYFGFALYCVVYLGLIYLASLPLSYYAGFIRPHSYDLSNQTLGKWLGDSIKEWAVLLAGALAVGWIPFVLIKRSPRLWWLHAGLLSLPLLCALFFILPVWIAPLFNQFQPMPDKRLEARVLALAARAGIDGSRVYQVNKSVDTSAVNAYVSGFMGTKRIVLWDTLVRTLNEDELLWVMGHEMGHFVLGDIARGIVLGFVLTLLSLYAIHRLAGLIIGRFKERFGFAVLSDYAALPLIILLGQLIAIAGMPLPLAFSRHQEHEADRFALELTHDNHAGATAFVKMQHSNLGISRPGMFYHLWLATHPSLGDRIDFCNSYRPWETGLPSKYDQYIKP